VKKGTETIVTESKRTGCLSSKEGARYFEQCLCVAPPMDPGDFYLRVLSFAHNVRGQRESDKKSQGAESGNWIGVVVKQNRRMDTKETKETERSIIRIVRNKRERGKKG
jgi:hypothetical protein